MAFVRRRLQPASQADCATRNRVMLRRVNAIFPGRYDNRRQRALELFHSHPAPHSLMIVQVDPIAWPDENGSAFLLRAYAKVDAAPFLARVYAFAPGWPGPGPVRLRVHTFDADPRILAANLDPAALPDLSGGAGRHQGRDAALAMRLGAIVCHVRARQDSKPIAGESDEVEELRLSIGDMGLHILTGRGDRLPYRLDRSYGTV